MEKLKSFLKPTKGKIILFVIITLFLTIVWITRIAVHGADAFLNPDIWVTIAAPFIAPLVVFHAFFVNSPGPIILAVYWYVVSCIYVAAWVWIDGAVKKKFPRLNAGWKI